MEKSCALCGKSFQKQKKLSYKQFEERVYCSKKCTMEAIGKNKDKSLDERFFNKITIPEDETKCWRWNGMTDKYGYGRIKPQNKPIMLAHRFSYELKFSKIPDGFIARHICNNPLCVNPNHIRLGKAIDNSKDCNISNRQGHKGTKFDYRVISMVYVCLKYGVSEKLISDVCGVSRQTINRVKNQKVWGNVLKDVESMIDDFYNKK